MTDGRTRLVVLAALLCGAGVVALVLASDLEDAQPVWAIFGPLVGWTFVGTGLYAWRRRPESRTGELMVLLGFAWFLAALHFAGSALVYTISVVVAGLWGGVFLHLVMSFPSGRVAPGLDRTLVIAGYMTFTVASIPAMLFASPHDLGCDDCPTNVLLVRRDHDVATIALGFETLLYVALFVAVLVRLTRRWRRTAPLERLQLTPVYSCGLLTFLLVTASTAGAGDATQWAALAATAALPFAFLAGLLRTRLAWLDAALADRAPVPVSLAAEGDERLPTPVEVAAYFVVAEALANVAKYAQATTASVAVRRVNGRVTVDVSDDGIGGADAARGSGLLGLADRVAALDGTLRVDSPAGGGTRLHVEIPV